MADDVHGIPGHDNTKPLEAWRRRFANATTCIKGEREGNLGNLQPSRNQSASSDTSKPFMLAAYNHQRLNLACFGPNLLLYVGNLQPSKASNLHVLYRTHPPTYSHQSLQPACFGPNLPLYVGNLQLPTASKLPVLGQTYPCMLGTYSYPSLQPACFGPNSPVCWQPEAPKPSLARLWLNFPPSVYWQPWANLTPVCWQPTAKASNRPVSCMLATYSCPKPPNCLFWVKFTPVGWKPTATQSLQPACFGQNIPLYLTPVCWQPTATKASNLPVCWQPTTTKASNLPVLSQTYPCMLATYSHQSLQPARFASNLPLCVGKLQLRASLVCLRGLGDVLQDLHGASVSSG